MSAAPQFGDARLPERFWDKVSPEPNSGCWIWCAAIKGLGYGHFKWDGKYHGTASTTVLTSSRTSDLSPRCRRGSILTTDAARDSAVTRTTWSR